METVYVIRDMNGVVVARHARVDLPDGKKSMFWEDARGHPGLGGRTTLDLPLYGSEILPKLDSGSTVMLVEGEKATRALWAHDIPAVGTVTGSSSTPLPSVLEPLMRFCVITCETGYKHLGRCVQILQDMRVNAYRLRWGEERGDDAADFWERGNTIDDLEDLVNAARPWPTPALPPTEPTFTRPYHHPRSNDRRDRARTQLYDVVVAEEGEPARLERQGAWWCCPFHTENTPSFKVSRDAPYFRCFGCGAKGDVFTYLQLKRATPFVEAINQLVPEKLWGASIPW